MNEQQIEGVPVGWRLVRIGRPKAGGWFIDASTGDPRIATCDWLGSIRVIIEKIEQPKQYRPFENAAEFEPHRDRWVRLKVNGAVSRVRTYFDYKACIGDLYFSWQEGFESLEFDDGTPFGVEVESTQ